MPQNRQQTIDTIGRMFRARSIAVVGASNDPRKYGCMTLDTIIKSGYEGEIYPINPKSDEILGLKAYKSLKDTPAPAEVVIVLVPAKFVPGILHDAADIGAAGVVVTSSGFKDMGNQELEGEIQAIGRERGLRFMGPNILGFTYLPNKLCAHFFPVLKEQGKLAIISQSGSLTNGLTEWAIKDGLGICATVNLGNQGDLCESDFLDFFAEDDNCSAIAMYLEGVKDGRKFLETIERVAPKKPIAVIKAGRSMAGQKSAASHTGSLAGSHAVFSAACRQYGVVPVTDFQTLYDFGKGLATISRPKGTRCLVISTSGGLGTLSVDEAEVLGMELPEPPEAMKEEMRAKGLAALGNIANPVDLAAIWAEELEEVAMLAEKYDVADCYLLNFGDPVAGAGEMIARLKGKIKAGLAVAYMGGGAEEAKDRPIMHAAGVPVYNTPERALRAMAAAMTAAGHRLNP